MCFSVDSAPPLSRGSVRGKDVTLRTYDGVDIDAFVAAAGPTSEVTVVLLPDVRGLHDYYKRLAECIALRGADVIAFDYYARTAGRLPRPPDFDPLPHRDAVSIEHLEGDFRTAVAAVDRHHGRVSRLYALGFCFGGRLAMYAAALDLPLAGVVSFYSPLKERHPVPHPRSVASRIACPVLGLFAGHDGEDEQISALGGLLTSFGVAHSFHTYDAPHSFFDDQFPAYAADAADAWRRVTRFLQLEEPARTMVQDP